MSSLADLPELVGFFSYSREDDADSRGALSALRGRIQGELRSQLGRSAKTFRLWQDKDAIPSGSLWESEIRNSVQQAVFFIPIITPTVVASPYCRFELDAFLAREAALGRSDLVFPILYIQVPALEDAARSNGDPVLSLIAKRQYVDWREFRHLDSDSTQVKRAVERFCGHIRDALSKPWTLPDERKQQAAAKDLPRAGTEHASQPAMVRLGADDAARRDSIAGQRQAVQPIEQTLAPATLETSERLSSDPADARPGAEVYKRRGPNAAPIWPASRFPIVLVCILGALLLGTIVVWFGMRPASVTVGPTTTSSAKPAPALVLPAAPAATPASPATVTHMGQLRFDGTYRSDGINGIYDHFRFYPDGKVISFWQRFPPQIKEPDPTATSFPEAGITSVYKMVDSKIEMSLPSSQGAVDYSGSITDNGLELHVFSHINNSAFDTQYQFIAFSH